eukprot:g5742.t1
MRHRPLDVLYETDFILSSSKDKLKEQTHPAYFYLDYVPDFTNYFSSLSNHPAARPRISPSTAIPSHLDRSFRPNGRTSARLVAAGEVGGKLWSKFFKTSPVLTAARPMASSTDIKVDASRKIIGVQTDYRDSETQTVPFEPELRVRNLDELRHGKNAVLQSDLMLLKGVEEQNCTVELVEKLRREQEFKRSLPPLDSEGALLRRQQMIAKYEKAKWKQRNNELEKTQNRKLESFEHGLYKQEGLASEQIESKTIRRFREKTKEHSGTRKTQTGSKAMDRETLKWLRQSSVKNTKNIDAFANVCSALYVPQERDGILLRKMIELDDTRGPMSVENLELIEHELTNNWKTSCDAKDVNKLTREALKLDKDLDVITEAIQESARDGTRGFGQCWISPESEQLTMANTKSEEMQNKISADAPDDEVLTKLEGDERIASITLLRRLVRGRMLQEYMIQQTKHTKHQKRIAT